MYRKVRIFFKLTLIASLTIGYSDLIFGKQMEIGLPVTQDLTLCAPAVVNLTATGSTGIYRWYNNASENNWFLTPTSVFVSQTTTFYVSAVQLVGNRLMESNRVPLTITVTSVTPPTTDTISICGASYNYMFAYGAGSNEVYHWYSSSLSQTPIKISEDEHDENLYEHIDSSSTYFVTIVNLTSGCESNRTGIPVHIKPTPSAPVIRTEPTICGSGTIQFEVQDEAGYAYLWYPCQTGCGYYVNRGGTGPANNGNTFDTYLYNYSNVSTYTVWVEKISLNDFCSSERVSLTATSYQVDAPTVPHKVYKCRSDIDTIIALMPPGSNSSAVINWYGDKAKTQLLGRGNVLTIPSSIHSRAAVYAVIYDSLFNHCESEIEDGEVMIYPGEVPSAPAVLVNENCGEARFIIQQSASGGRYLWYTHDTLNAVHIGYQLVNYTNSEYTSNAFYVCFETADGCRGSTTRVEGHPLEILPAPQVASIERCGPGSMKLNVTGNGKYTRYRWYNSSGYLMIGENDAEYTTPYLYSSSSYSVAMIGSNGCESERRQIQAVVKPGPSIGVSNDFVCRGESVALYGAGGNMYLWSENNIAISNRTNIYVNPLVTTTYTLTDPTVAGPCRTASYTIKVNKSSECGALELENNFTDNYDIIEYSSEYKVYPNPFTEEFSIHSSFKDAACRILDLTGTELYYFPEGSIDLKSIKPILNPGQYILEIKTSEKIYREKLIKL